jgi:hypothetical protein
MKRFRRWLFNGIAGVSLALFLATVTMWIFSYRRTFEEVRLIPNNVVGAETTGGSIGLVWSHWEPLGSGELPPATSNVSRQYPRVGVRWSYANVAPGQYPRQNKGFGIQLGLPCWLPTCILGFFPTVWLFKRPQNHRDPNLCCTCGYDLRATPDRCPECGTIPPKEKEIFYN